MTNGLVIVTYVRKDRPLVSSPVEHTGEIAVGLSRYHGRPSHTDPHCPWLSESVGGGLRLCTVPRCSVDRYKGSRPPEFKETSAVSHRVLPPVSRNSTITLNCPGGPRLRGTQMSDTDSSQPVTPHSDARFATTHWTVVLAAGSPDSTRHREALETLCRSYWFPLYAYLRRHGYDRHDAAEHIQAFFAKMLEKQSLNTINPQPGKFRSFLLTALKRFVADEREREHAQKRGGGREVLSLNINDAESRYAIQPVDRLSPDRLFERSWALTVLNRVMDRLEAEMTAADKRQLFDQARAHLCGTCDAVSYREVAATLHMNEGAVKVVVHRMRNRYREILREEIAQTVSSPNEVDEEIRGLFAALSR